MDAYLAMLARRSVRSYKKDIAVPQDKIDLLLQAAMAAPSATNRRPWEFIVVNEEQALKNLYAALPLGRHGAPCAIVVCADVRRAVPVAPEFWVQDTSAAMQNMLNMAAAVGLGSLWVGVHPVAPIVSAVSRALGLPSHIKPLGVALVGYAENSPVPRTQYEPERVHYQAYDPSLARPVGLRKLFDRGKKG